MSQNVTILTILGHWNSRKAKSPPSLSWGEERTKILLLACCYQDAWHAESEGIPGTAYETTATETTFDFVGAKPGRWRVWPVNGNGQRSNPSDWRTFRYP